MTSFWQRLASHLRQGRPVFVALVAEHTRHSPGTAGARLLATLADGAATVSVQGTIGGGIMEHRLLERAREVLVAGEAFFEVAALEHRRPGEVDARSTPSGMICAGRQHNVYSLCRPREEGPVVESLLERLDRGAHGVLEISRHGWRVVSAAADLDGPRRRLRSAADGHWIYREELLERRRLALFGGGHCALALARLCRRLGYDIVAFEGAKKSPDPDLRHHVRKIVQVDDFRRAAAQVEVPTITSAVVLTSDFPSDVRALIGALGQPFPFIGVMGSAAKVEEIRRRLIAEGFSANDLQRLVAPVGLPMLSNTPDEIAVSIASQLLRRRAEELESATSEADVFGDGF